MQSVIVAFFTIVGEGLRSPRMYSQNAYITYCKLYETVPQANSALLAFMESTALGGFDGTIYVPLFGFLAGKYESVGETVCTTQLSSAAARIKSGPRLSIMRWHTASCASVPMAPLPAATNAPNRLQADTSLASLPSG